MTLIELHTARLKRLAYLVARTPEQPKGRRTLRERSKGRFFNMRTWGTHFGKHEPNPKENFCGTAACALGTAGLDRKFNEAGLLIEWQRLGRSQWNATITFQGGEIMYTDEAAGAIFFGLTSAEAIDLFLGTWRPKVEVLKRIRYYAEHRSEIIPTVA